ncbi:MAG: hypothetical protein FWG73_09075 [Planctomycetaceae bacterium]|nr:hypothetical protein [Planctomycetaceae bacterium]
MISLGFLIVVILFWLSLLITPLSVGIFWDPLVFSFVLSGLTGYILICGRKEFARGIKAFFAFSLLPDDEAGRFFQRLTTFTVRWGLFGMLLGLASIMLDLDLDTMGIGIAFCLLSVLYTLGLAGFVFLPIGLRLSPSETHPSFWKMTVNLSLAGLAVFVLLACIRVLADIGHFGSDMFLVKWGFHMIGLYLDIPSFILVVGCWWAFRLASGRRQKWIAAPVIILIGVFWSIQSFIFMLSAFDPEIFGPGLAICLLTTLYAFIAAAGFLIADMWSSFEDPPPSPPAEGMEQVKEIIDRVVEDVQSGKR